MIIQLNIKNFALIEEISVQFNQGFNILSGETGAGKSILIDAIDYVLGGKFSKDLIRTGENKTFVEAIFSIDNNNVKSVLDEMEIEYDDTLIISRESAINGKSLVRVNGKSLIVSQLKKIREKILDIHGQHQSQRLLDKTEHISYLDNYIGEELNKPLKEFLELKQELSEVKDKINQIKGDQDREKLIDYVKFQIEDIEKGKLRIGEEEELKEEYSVLSNAEKINKALTTSYSLLKNEEQGAILESLSKVITELSLVDQHFDKIKNTREALEGAYYTLEESTREIRDLGEEIVYDEDRLANINQRIYEINNYKKKYGSTVEDILNNYADLKKRYQELINSEQILAELDQKMQDIINKMKQKGKILHDIRCKYNSSLEKKLLKELSYVGLEKSRMEIRIELTDEFNDNGCDDVSFLISTNPGEPLKSLERVLSGGELSRIMLAFKCVFAEKDDISTLIFDEIDTGISGIVGQRVGEKMYQVSLGHQVLCITHLPQIAILSDHHFFVSKEVKDNKTYTKIKLLDINEKIKQVASMLGGEVTEATINNVKEMYGLAENKKNEIRKK